MNDLAAVIHVERMFDGRLQFTVVPLLYGSYALKQGRGNFNLEPPAILNPAGGLPVVRGQSLQDSSRPTPIIKERGAVAPSPPEAPRSLP